MIQLNRSQRVVSTHKTHKYGMKANVRKMCVYRSRLQLPNNNEYDDDLYKPVVCVETHGDKELRIEGSEIKATEK